MSCRPQRAIRLTDAAAGRPASPLEGIFLFLHRLTLWLVFDARLQHNAVFQWRSRDSSSMTYLIFAAAALAEIAGCFAFWAWWRLDKSPLWLAPGLAALIAFAWLLTSLKPSSPAAPTPPMAASIFRRRCCGCGPPRGSAPTVGMPSGPPSALSARPLLWRRRAGGDVELPAALRQAIDRLLEGAAIPELRRASDLLSRRNRTELRDGRLHLSDDLAVKA